MSPQPVEDAVQLLRVEYLEIPGLALTPSDVAALLDLDDVTVAALLDPGRRDRRRGAPGARRVALLGAHPGRAIHPSQGHDLDVAVTSPAVSDTLWAMLPSPDPSALQAFLADPARPAGTLRYHELQGFLFTVASAPELIPPSDWLPIIFGDQEADYASRDKAQEILGQIMVLYNTAAAVGRDDAGPLPVDGLFRDDILANFNDDAPIAQWSRGFLLGHQWLEELWQEYLPEELAEELAATIMTLSFFSSRRLAEAFLAEATAPARSLEALAETMRRVFPNAVMQYAHLGRSITTALLEHATEAPGPARTAKVGRNAPCPCGSGKKYKRCCAATVH